MTELVYCVTVVFTMTERADQLHYDNAPAHSTVLVQAFLATHHITQVCQPPPLQPKLGSLALLAFLTAKIAFESEEIRPATSWVHYTTSCNTQSSAPEDGQNNCPKHVELTGIIN